MVRTFQKKLFRIPAEHFRTPGIVIRMVPTGESDLILRVLTEQYGTISLFARFARSHSKAKKGLVDLLDHGVLEGRSGKGDLPIFVSLKPLKGFHSLRQDLKKVTIAYNICELYDLLLVEGSLQEESAKSAYDALSLTLSAISEATSITEALRALFVSITHLLKIAGYASDPLFQRKGINDPIPSLKNLRLLLDFAEELSEGKLQTRSSLEDFVLQQL